MPCLVLTEILLKVNKYQFLFSIKYAVNFCVVEACAKHTQRQIISLIKCQINQKTRLICIFLVVDVASKMVGNVLVKFGGTGYSFYFDSNFKVLKVVPDSVHGSGPCAHHFEGSYYPENTLEITYSRSVPLN